MELPGLPEKGDVSDWLDDGHTVEELEEIVDQIEVLAPSAEAAKASSTEEKDDSEKKSIATRVIQLVKESGIELFQDDRKEPFAAIVTNEGRRIVALESKTCRRWVQRLTFTKMNVALSRGILASVKETLVAPPAKCDYSGSNRG